VPGWSEAEARLAEGVVMGIWPRAAVKHPPRISGIFCRPHTSLCLTNGRGAAIEAAMTITARSTTQEEPISPAPKIRAKLRVEPASFSDEKINEIAQLFQERAKDASRTANVGIVMAICLAFAMMFLFVFSIARFPQYM
jgi:hypothetical protein